MGIPQGIPSKTGFRPTGEPWGESYTGRSGVMVRKAFPPFPTKKIINEKILRSGFGLDPPINPMGDVDILQETVRDTEARESECAV